MRVTRVHLAPTVGAQPAVRIGDFPMPRPARRQMPSSSQPLRERVSSVRPVKPKRASFGVVS